MRGESSSPLWAEPKRDLRGFAFKEDACNITEKIRHREGAKPVCNEKGLFEEARLARENKGGERGEERVLGTEASSGLGKNWTVHSR